MVPLLNAERPQVVMLQETALLAQEEQAFIAEAGKRGYNGFFSGAQVSSVRPHGGAMMLIRKSLSVYRLGHSLAGMGLPKLSICGWTLLL